MNLLCDSWVDFGPCYTTATLKATVSASQKKVAQMILCVFFLGPQPLSRSADRGFKLIAMLIIKKDYNSVAFFRRSWVDNGKSKFNA